MSRRALALITPLALSACIHSGATSMAVGSDQYMVACGRAATYCAQEADRLCAGRPYDVSGYAEDEALFSDFGRAQMVIRCR
jgi:hypothetical protein